MKRESSLRRQFTSGRSHSVQPSRAASRKLSARSSWLCSSRSRDCSRESVALAADSREQSLDRELHNQDDRAESFLEAALLGCTEWDRPEVNCLRKELSRFMKEEHAIY